jgi:histone H3/H4
VEVNKGRRPQSQEEVEIMELNIRRAVRELGQENKNLYALTLDRLAEGVRKKVPRKTTHQQQKDYTASYIKKTFSSVMEDEREQIFKNQLEAAKKEIGDLSGMSGNEIISKIASKLATSRKKLKKHMPTIGKLAEEWAKGK